MIDQKNFALLRWFKVYCFTSAQDVFQKSIARSLCVYSRSLSGRPGSRKNGLFFADCTEDGSINPKQDLLEYCKIELLPISLGNATFGCFIVGRASRLPSNDLPKQARRPRYIKAQKQAAFGIIPKHQRCAVTGINAGCIFFFGNGIGF